jgi:hypothetical protein
MLILGVSEVKLPGDAKQNNLLPKCGQQITGVEKFLNIGKHKAP